MLSKTAMSKALLKKSVYLHGYLEFVSIFLKCMRLSIRSPSWLRSMQRT